MNAGTGVVNAKNFLAGRVAFSTPRGTFISPNLTPDPTRNNLSDGGQTFEGLCVSVGRYTGGTHEPSMLMLIRQLIAILALPSTVAIAIPMWIARRNHLSVSSPQSLTSLVLVLCGAALLVVGLTLFAASVFYFWSRGRGTLAPWDPPRHFVVEGPYRFVRNPMISGVIFVLFGEALVLRSRPHAEWAALFVLINAIYIPALEEPMLVARFGEPYRQYRRTVWRFLPRLRPWHPEVT